MNLMEQVLKDLRRHEGCRLSPYKDTEGVWTIGYGHTRGVTKDTKPITQERAEELLTEEAYYAVQIARKVFKTYDNLGPVRRSVVINMAFNLGQTRLSGFKKMIAAIEVEDYSRAALEMLNSRWATQVGQRATELAARMSSNKIPDHLTYKETRNGS